MKSESRGCGVSQAGPVRRLTKKWLESKDERALEESALEESALEESSLGERECFGQKRFGKYFRLAPRGSLLDCKGKCMYLLTYRNFKSAKHKKDWVRNLFAFRHLCVFGFTSP